MTTAPGTYGFIALLVFGAAFELGTWVQYPAKGPGNIGNPVGWGSYDDEMRNKEINHGRFAIFAALGSLQQIWPLAYMRFSSLEHEGTLCQFSDREQIHQLYGSLGRTMMTRCRTASGGMEWFTAAAPIVKLGTGYSVIWSSYIAFLMFGMLYVLKGIFVDAAISVMN